MTTVRDVAQKLRAWEAGRPVPRYATIHHAVMPADQVLIVAFVRMAGESRPWGIAWGTPAVGPTIRSVPDSRVRDDVAVLVAEFAEELLSHLRVHNWTFDPAPEKPDVSELRQVWLPNGQHVEMLHQLNYTYSQTRFGGTNQEILRALGRLAGWMFRDTCRIGNQHVVSASGLLGDAYVFPAQNARTAHLGYQLAWLTTDGDRDVRIAAAAAAERLTVSPTMDPSLDRDSLNDLVERWQAGRREDARIDDEARRISAILAAELDRRWALTAQAYDLIARNSQPVNAGADELVEESHKEFWYQHQRIELRLNDPNEGPAFVAHPETDFHGSSAASRYLANEAADEAYVSCLIHDDPVLFEEALADGLALQAAVVHVRDIGEGRKTVPQWTLRIDPSAPHRLRDNARLTPYGSRGHEAKIVGMNATDDELLVTIEWIGKKTMPLRGPIAAKPVDLAWVGTEIAFVQSDASGLTRRRSQRVWAAKDGPGAWLTHGKAAAPLEVSNDTGPTDLVYDDVAQISEGVEV